MKIKYLLSILINIILLISLVNAQTVSHPASQVTSGTFGSGDFTFIGDVTIDNTAFSKLKIDSGPSGYSSVDFFNNGVGEWGIGKDSSNKFYIDESGVSNRLTILPGGNVGIGTVNPSGKLDVRRNIIGGSVSVADSNIYVRGSDNGYGIAIGLSNANAAGFFQGMLNDAASIPLLLNPSGGNVGIGTAGPSNKLQVGSPGGTNYALAIANPTSDGWGMYINTNTGGATSDNTKAALEITTPAGSSRFRITNAGNVGIGTTGPGYAVGAKLDVRGDVLAKSKLYLANSGFNAGDDDTFILDGSTSGKLKFSYRWAGGPTIYDRMIIDTNGNVGIGTVNPSQKLDVAGQIHSTGDICTDVGGGNCLSTVASASNSGWTDDGANVRLVTSTDKVGIGTSTPGTKIHVVGNANTLRVEGTDHTYIEFYPDGPLTRKAYLGFPDAASNDIRLKNEIAAGHIILEPGANVGIGALIPTQKLHVVGNARITGLISCNTIDTDASGNLACGTDTGITSETDPTVLASVKDGVSWAELIGIPAGFADNIDNTGDNDWTISGTNMYSGVSGNVGIGTASPSLQLEVKQSSALASAGIELENSAGTTTQLRMRGASESGGSRFSIVQNGNDAFTISNTGNVGIGTPGPSAKLDVLSSGAGTTVFEARSASAPSSATTIQESSPQGDTYLRIYDTLGNENVRIRAVGSSWFNGGSVGIGTSSPTAGLTLDVEGPIGATVYCDQNGNNCKTIAQLLKANKACPPDQFVTGFDANGELICAEAIAGAVCGDGTCDLGENPTSCPADCTQQYQCPSIASFPGCTGSSCVGQITTSSSCQYTGGFIDSPYGDLNCFPPTSASCTPI